MQRPSTLTAQCLVAVVLLASSATAFAFEKAALGILDGKTHVGSWNHVEKVSGTAKEKRNVSTKVASEPIVFAHDALGSIVARVDASNTTATTLQRFDAWGTLRGVPYVKPAAGQNQLAYTGHIFDPETQLHYAKARYLDNGLGRFLSEDPMLGKLMQPTGLNRFSYVGGMPTRLTDPTGRCGSAGGPANEEDCGEDGRVRVACEGGDETACRAVAFGDGVAKGAVVGGAFAFFCTAMPGICAMLAVADATTSSAPLARTVENGIMSCANGSTVGDEGDCGQAVGTLVTLAPARPASGEAALVKEGGLVAEKPIQVSSEAPTGEASIQPAGTTGPAFSYAAAGKPRLPKAGLPKAKPNLNSNGAVSEFGLYEIYVNGVLHKIGKADLKRRTQSSGLPTRLHQQLRNLRKKFGKENVKGKVVQELGEVTTAAAKAAETGRIRAQYEATGVVPPGNEKSFKP